MSFPLTSQVCSFQRAILARLQQQAGGGADVSSLEEDLLDISDLYNGYAHPHRMWDICLQIVHFSGGASEAVVRGLWDNLIKQVNIQRRGRAQPTHAQQTKLSLTSKLSLNIVNFTLLVLLQPAV